MARAALRLLGFLLCCGGLRAEEIRRPVPALEINGREYVRILDVATRLKLSLRWIEPGAKDRAHRRGAPPHLELSGGRQVSAASKSSSTDSSMLGDPVVARGGDLFVSRIDMEHRLVPFLHPTWADFIPRHPRVIALDPGHGGFDPGFQNPALHLQEKVLALDTAFRLKRLLEKAGYQVVMTRTDDHAVAATKELDLPRRPEIANLARADLFVSIHFNSDDPDPRPHGTEIYIFPPAHQNSTDDEQAHKDKREPNKAHPTVAAANRFDHWSAILVPISCTGGSWRGSTRMTGEKS